ILMMIASIAAPSTSSAFASVALPFLIADVTALVLRIGDALASRSAEIVQRQGAMGLAFLVGFHLLISPVDALSFPVGGEIPGTYPQPVDGLQWRIPQINRVAQAVDRAMPPGATMAISWWPGYLVESRSRLLPGLENPSAVSRAAGLPW